MMLYVFGCPVGCGARAVCRKTPLYFMLYLWLLFFALFIFHQDMLVSLEVSIGLDKGTSDI